MTAKFPLPFLPTFFAPFFEITRQKLRKLAIFQSLSLSIYSRNFCFFFNEIILSALKRNINEHNLFESNQTYK